VLSPEHEAKLQPVVGLQVVSSIVWRKLEQPVFFLGPLWPWLCFSSDFSGGCKVCSTNNWTIQ